MGAVAARTGARRKAAVCSGLCVANEDGLPGVLVHICVMGVGQYTGEIKNDG